MGGDERPVEHDLLRLEREPAARGHGVAGVEAQVHDDLVDLGAVGQHVRQLERGHEVDFDAFGQQPPQQLNECVDAGVEVERFELERLFAGQGEQLPGDAGGAVGGFGRVVEVRLLGRRQRARRQQVQVRGDDGEQVVEVVRHATGQERQALDALNRGHAPLECFVFALGFGAGGEQLNALERGAELGGDDGQLFELVGRGWAATLITERARAHGAQLGVVHRNRHVDNGAVAELLDNGFVGARVDPGVGDDHGVGALEKGAQHGVAVHREAGQFLEHHLFDVGGHAQEHRHGRRARLDHDEPGVAVPGARFNGASGGGDDVCHRGRGVELAVESQHGLKINRHHSPKAGTPWPATRKAEVCATPPRL